MYVIGVSGAWICEPDVFSNVCVLVCLFLFVCVCVVSVLLSMNHIFVRCVVHGENSVYMMLSSVWFEFESSELVCACACVCVCVCV